MTTITNNNLFSRSYSVVKTFIESISNIDSRSRNKGNWIHASLPDINSKGFDGYPFIVLRIDVQEDSKSFNPAISQKIFRVLIQIYSDDAVEVDSITDKIYSAAKDELNLTDFGSKEISSSPLNYDLDLRGKKITYRNLGLLMRERI